MTEKEKALIEAKANILKALGHPTRLWMAEQLAGGEKCVCELAENIDADFSTLDTTRNAPRAAKKPNGLPPSQPVRTMSAIAAPFYFPALTRWSASRRSVSRKAKPCHP